MKKLLTALMFLFIATGVIFAEDKEFVFDRDTYIAVRDIGGISEYLEKYPYRSLDISFSKSFNPLGSSQVLIILAESTYYNNEDIGWRVDRYAKDCSYQSYNTQVYIYNAGNPTDLRNWIKAHQAGLSGIIFMGDIAAAWFEHDNDLNLGYHAEFPTDVYYADLDGVYGDQDGDGAYDSYSGDVDLEIFVSRFTSSTVNDIKNIYLTPVSQMIMYLNYTHKYFRGIGNYGTRGVNFIDEDWDDNNALLNRLVGIYNGNWYLMIDENFSYHTFIPAIENNKYETVILDIHASAYLFGFDIWLYSSDFDKRNLTPKILFLGACSACRFTEENTYQNLSSAMLFAKTSKIQSIMGMTKTAFNRYNEKYFEYLGQGYNSGEAWKKWYNYTKNRLKTSGHSYSSYYWSWHGGEILLGNPIVKANLPINYISNRAPELNGQTYIEMKEGNSYNINLDISDYDSDDVNIIIQSPPEGFTIENGHLLWSPSYTQGGTYNINVGLNDGYITRWTTITIKVIEIKKG